MEATVAEGIKIMTLTFHDGTKMAGSVRPIAANCIAIFQFCEPIGIVSITIFELRKWKRTVGRPFPCYFPNENGSLLFSVPDSDWRCTDVENSRI